MSRRAGRADPLSGVLAGLVAAAATAGGVPQAADPGARLPEGEAAAEHWDLAAHFDSGHRLYARFLVTNVGPGQRTALAFGHLLRPDAPPVEFHNGRRAGRWELSEDRRRIAIGSSVLELGDSAHHFEVDNDKRDIEIHLDFAAGAGARGVTAPGGYHMDLLCLATPARGDFQVAGMAAPRSLQGRAVLSHTYFTRAEGELIARRTDVAIFGGPAPLFLSVVDPPTGSPFPWLVAGGGSWSGPEALEVVAQGPRGDSYPVPSTLRLRGKYLDGVITLGATRLTVDPLDALPTLLRMVYSFGLRPRHLWVQAEADVALKSPGRDAVLQIQGEGIASLAFLDALPPRER